jgi:hypothetical protein
MGMANTVRIKRRLSGSPDAPSTLANGELAYNEVSDTLYYGSGSDGGQAINVIPIGGQGAYFNLSAIAGNEVYSNTVFTSGYQVTFSGTVSGDGLYDYLGTIPLDVLAPAENNINLNSHKIINLADPVDANDAANKGYVDAARSGLDVKASCRAATVSNITLSGTQTIDGVSLLAGDRVLVKNQTAGADNGIYIVASGAWSRSADADSSLEFNSGMFIFVEEGTVNLGRGYVLTTPNPITLGTTELEFTQFSSLGAITAGIALSFSGTTLNVNVDNTSVAINASNEIEIHSSWAGQSAINTVGTISTGTWEADIVALDYGGTGADLSAEANGTIFKKYNTGFVAASAGTDYLNDSSTIDGGTF